MKTYQVIRYDVNALTCHSEVKSLGFFDTKEEAEEFAATVPTFGASIFVRAITIGSK